MTDENRNTGGLIAMIAAASAAAATGLGLLVIALFSLPNLIEAAAWSNMALLVAGVIASVVAVPLSLYVGQRAMGRASVSWGALAILGAMGVAATRWSLQWVDDPGDWPFFGGPALVFACAAGALVLMAVVRRGEI